MLEISRKDITESKLMSYEPEVRFIKLPVEGYLELLNITPIPSQIARPRLKLLILVSI